MVLEVAVSCYGLWLCLIDWFIDCCKFAIFYMCQKNYENLLAGDNVTAVIKGVPFLLRDALVQSAVLRLHVVCPSVCNVVGSGTQATDFKFSRYIHRSIEQKPIKNFGERGSAQIFWVPPIISRMGKATNFKFCTRIHTIDRNKPLKFSWKVAMGILRESQKFSGHPYIGRIVRSSLR